MSQIWVPQKIPRDILEPKKAFRARKITGFSEGQAAGQEIAKFCVAASRQSGTTVPMDQWTGHRGFWEDWKVKLWKNLSLTSKRYNPYGVRFKAKKSILLDRKKKKKGKIISNPTQRSYKDNFKSSMKKSLEQALRHFGQSWVKNTFNSPTFWKQNGFLVGKCSVVWGCWFQLCFLLMPQAAWMWHASPWRSQRQVEPLNRCFLAVFDMSAHVTKNKAYVECMSFTSYTWIIFLYSDDIW